VEAQLQVLREMGHGEPRSGGFAFGDAPLRVLERSRPAEWCNSVIPERVSIHGYWGSALNG